MRNLLWAIIFVMVLLGCASTKEYEKTLDSWVNRSVTDLIQAWGMPTDVSKLQDGKTIYSWSVNRDESTFIDGTVYNIRKTCDTTFTVNERGIIETWHFKGSECGN
jgi:hypothetical protein